MNVLTSQLGFYLAVIETIKSVALHPILESFFGPIPNMLVGFEVLRAQNVLDVPEDRQTDEGPLAHLF